MSDSRHARPLPETAFVRDEPTDGPRHRDDPVRLADASLGATALSPTLVTRPILRLRSMREAFVLEDAAGCVVAFRRVG